MTKTRDLANLADLNFDSGTMVVDKTNDRVGVGNPTPSATLDVDGTIKLDGNYPTGTANVALGNQALSSGSLSGGLNTAVGNGVLLVNTSGANNSGFGTNSLITNSTGSNNTGIGKDALYSNTTASNNTAVGYSAGYATTTGTGNAILGAEAGDALTTGSYNTVMGQNALSTATSPTHNTAIGQSALYLTSTGAYNTGIGASALYSNTTASYNTAMGYQAGLNNTTGNVNVFLGRGAGYGNTTGAANTYVGDNSGVFMTTGSNNTILGRYNGNQGGLDIRTSSNNIVLSDGDGNPRLVNNGSSTIVNSYSTASSVNYWSFSNNSYGAENNADGAYNSTRIRFKAAGTEVGSIYSSGSTISYNTTSDYRLKENVVDLTGAADRVQQLNPVRFNFIVDADTTVDGFLAHEVADIVPEAITGEKDAVDDEGNIKPQAIDQSKLVPLLTAALQEALTKIDQLETRIAALEAN